MQEMTIVLIQAIGVGGGLAAVLYGAFHLFGVKWLEEKFAQRLETFKHEKTRELERLKFEINSIFSRVAKLHEREFEVLPQLWDKLNQADLALQNCVMSFTSMPDLDRLTDEQLEEFLSGTTFGENDKRLIRESDDKVRQFGRLLGATRINDARNAFAGFQSYLKLQRVFIRPELAAKLETLATSMWKFWVSIHMAEKVADSDIKGWQEYDAPSKLLISEIEKLIHQRLYPSHEAGRNDPLA